MHPINCNESEITVGTRRTPDLSLPNDLGLLSEYSHTFAFSARRRSNLSCLNSFKKLSWHQLLEQNVSWNSSKQSRLNPVQIALVCLRPTHQDGSPSVNGVRVGLQNFCDPLLRRGRLTHPHLRSSLMPQRKATPHSAGRSTIYPRTPFQWSTTQGPSTEGANINHRIPPNITPNPNCPEWLS